MKPMDAKATKLYLKAQDYCTNLVYNSKGRRLMRRAMRILTRLEPKQ